MKQERKTICKIRVGSHLYGLNTKDSDEDFISVFIPSPKDILGLNRIDEIDNSTKSSNEDRRNTSEDIDDKAYALPKFMSLLLQNNPNIVELLFATKENILWMEPEFKFLMDNYKRIISQKVIHSFSGYAFSQKKKLTTKAERFHNLETAIKSIEAVYSENELKDPQRIIDDIESSRLNGWAKFYKGLKGNPEPFHKGMSIKMIYEKIKYEYENYGWRVKTDSFEKLGYDTKFAYHLIRLFVEGIELLETGSIIFPIDGGFREDILKVRNGQLSYTELLELYEFYEAKFNSIKDKCILQKKPNFNFFNDWLVKVLSEHIMEYTHA